MTTYDAYAYSDTHLTTDARRISGVPGLAVRLGRALETWGRNASDTFEPVDEWRRQRELDRKFDTTARMLASQSRSLRHM